MSGKKKLNCSHKQTSTQHKYKKATNMYYCFAGLTPIFLSRANLSVLSVIMITHFHRLHQLLPGLADICGHPVVY